MDCVFCKIANGELDCEKIYETDRVMSFLDINPRAPGHSLVIPKEHVERLTELDDSLVEEVFIVVKKVEKILENSIKPNAFTVGINDGKSAGQEIPHLHVNIIPRFEGDQGKPIHAVVNNPPKKEISEIAKKIRNKAKD